MTQGSGGQGHRNQRYERLTSAGGVVYRYVVGQLQVLLCGRREPPLWSLPKGTPDPHETIEETALREVREETGVDVTIVDDLGFIRYFFTRSQDNTRFDKRVYHYLMQPIGGDLSLHDHEFDDVQWFPIERALEVMTYANEANVVRRAIEALEAKPHLRAPIKPDVLPEAEAAGERP